MNLFCIIGLGVVTYLLFRLNTKSKFSLMPFFFPGLIIIASDILLTLALFMSIIENEYFIRLLIRISLGLEGAFIVFYCFGFLENRKNNINDNLEMIKYVLSGLALFSCWLFCNDIIVSFDSGILIGSKRFFLNQSNKLTWYSLYSYMYTIIIPIFCAVFSLFLNKEKSFFTKKYKTLILIGLLLIFFTLSKFLSYRFIQLNFIKILNYLILMFILYLFIRKEISTQSENKK